MVADSEPPLVFRVTGKPGLTVHVPALNENRFTMVFEPAARLTTHSWLLVALHRASPVLVARVSTRVPVSRQVWSGISWWMSTGPALVTMSAHQEPPAYQSLLCGLSWVGDATP